MLVSKLNNKYPLADPAVWVKGNYDELDPIFAGRLAAMAASVNTVVVITEGYRSTERQKELYAQFLEYKRTGKGSIKSAAVPGSSWHEFRLAIDTSTYPVRGWSDEQLHKFGLCKPIKTEGWHIQPLETKGQSNRVKWAPVYEEEKEMTEAETRAMVKKINSGMDSKVSEWANDSWEKAKAEGVIDGTRPGGQVTREELAVILDRLGVLK